MKTKLTCWLPFIVYFLLSLALLGVLLNQGYILTLDMPWGPHLDQTSSIFGLNNNLFSDSPYLMVLRVAGLILSSWLVQKIILVLVFLLAGWGAHRLFKNQGIGAYFAGALYMINPFTYVRFMSGQLGVLMAYALTPFALKAFLDLLTNRDYKSIIKVAILSTLVGMLQLHGFVLLFLIFLILLLVFSLNIRNHAKLIASTLKSVALSAGLFIILNLYWLVPTLTAGSGLLGQIDSQDQSAFTPQSGVGGRVMFEIAAMYGFWRGGYVYAKDLLPFWWLLFIFILFLAVFGFVSRLNSSSSPKTDTRRTISPNAGEVAVSRLTGLNWVTLSFGLFWIIGLLLAVGAAAPQTQPAFNWLWTHFPLLRGFRDSQKFVALLCLAYAYLGGLGVKELVDLLKKQGQKLTKIAVSVLVALALLTPLVYSFTSFGFHGQLKVTDYPQDWYQANDYLNLDKSDVNVLVLPWHQYMDFDWLPNQDKRLANPAVSFFDKPVIQGDNLEMPGIYSQSTNPISKYVEFLLANQSQIDNLGELLAPLNVKYVILLHEADYSAYGFLNQQTDLKLSFERPGLTIFENQHSLARIYGVDSVVHVQSLDEYLKLSREQDVMDHIYVLGSGIDSTAAGQSQTLSFVEQSPVDYQVEGASRKYVVFTVPQGINTEKWQSNGQDPVLRNLGFMPVFEASGQGHIVYSRFYQIYLPAYIVSGLALLGIGCFFLYRNIKKRRSSAS